MASEEHREQVFDIMIKERNDKIREHMSFMNTQLTRYPGKYSADLREHIFDLVEGLENEVKTLEAARKWINDD